MFAWLGRQMTPSRKNFEAFVDEEFPASKHSLIGLGEAVLRLEQVEDAVLVGWVSDLDVIHFLHGVVSGGDRFYLTTSRVSPDAVHVDPQRLMEPDNLLPAECDAIHLVRVDYPEDGAALVWERLSEGQSDVAVLSSTWDSAQRYLLRVLPEARRLTVAKLVADYALEQ